MADKPYVVLKRRDIEAVIADNSAIDDALLPGHRAGYHGLASLKHGKQPENLFVPSYSGLNLEHSHDGTRRGDDVLFEPRKAPMELRLINEHTAELFQPPTPNWKLESSLRYAMLADGTIDLTVECMPREAVFRNGYINLFFASYIHQPESPDIHFLGHDADAREAEPRWIRGITPAHGKLSTHRAAGDAREFAHGRDFPLTLVFNFSEYRYAEPWYYGISHGMAWVLMFRKQDQVRFTQSPSGGGKGNPAWDFQWFVPKVEADKRYTFVMRATYLPFESPEQILDATAGHRAELNPTGY